MALDPPVVPVTGVRDIERAAGIDFRWLTGPKATLLLNLDAPRMLRLVFVASNPLEAQAITVSLNRAPVATFENIAQAQRLSGFTRYEAILPAQAGKNVLTLEFARYNHRTPEDSFAPDDKDQLALIVRELTITPATPEALP